MSKVQVFDLDKNNKRVKRVGRSWKNIVTYPLITSIVLLSIYAIIYVLSTITNFKDNSIINWIGNSDPDKKYKVVYDDNLIDFMNQKKSIVPVDENGIDVVKGVPHTIEFINVSFSYPGSDKKVLDNISKDAFIIDIAPLDCGIDLEYAKMINLNAVNIPGIPGKVSPISSANILYDYILNVISPYL